MKQINWGKVGVLVNEMITEESGWRSVQGIEVNHAYVRRLDLVTFTVRVHDVNHYLRLNRIGEQNLLSLNVSLACGLFQTENN